MQATHGSGKKNWIQCNEQQISCAWLWPFSWLDSGLGLAPLPCFLVEARVWGIGEIPGRQHLRDRKACRILRSKNQTYLVFALPSARAVLGPVMEARTRVNTAPSTRTFVPQQLKALGSSKRGFQRLPGLRIPPGLILLPGTSSSLPVSSLTILVLHAIPVFC